MIAPEKTAITTGVSLSCRELISDIDKSNNHFSILDYGCGRLRNSRHIIENGYKVDVLDTEKQLQNIKKSLSELNITNFYAIDSLPKDICYTHILLSFVLNVIPNHSDRVKLISKVRDIMNPTSILYLEVRNRSFINSLKTKKVFNDGFVVGKGKIKTFQKGYTSEEIINFCETNQLNVIYKKNTSGSIFLKLQKAVG